jgi:GntR family transcriptional regulator
MFRLQTRKKLAFMLKRAPSLTEQVKAHLKQRILNAEFEDGRLPSEFDLATELNVGRSTIREALSRLESEGIIFRRQGAGTFVNETGLQIKAPLDEIWNYEAVLESYGYRASTKVVEVTEEASGPESAPDLGVEAWEPLLVVKKIFLADTKPVIVTVNYIPRQLVTESFAADDLQRPVYEFFSQFCRQELTYYFSEIIPLAAPDWLADWLQLPSGQRTLLSFAEIGYNQENAPILKSCSYFRDDMLRLRLIRRRTLVHR